MSLCCSLAPCPVVPFVWLLVPYGLPFRLPLLPIPLFSMAKGVVVLIINDLCYNLSPILHFDKKSYFFKKKYCLTYCATLILPLSLYHQTSKNKSSL